MLRPQYPRWNQHQPKVSCQLKFTRRYRQGDDGHEVWKRRILQRFQQEEGVPIPPLILKDQQSVRKHFEFRYQTKYT